MPRWSAGNPPPAFGREANTQASGRAPVATQRCPRCGAFGPAGTAFCAFCGAPLPGTAGAPLPPGGPPPTFGPPPPGTGGGYAAPGTWGTPGGASPQFPAAETTALTYVIWAAVLILVAGALDVAADLAPSSSSTGLHFGTAFLAVSLGAGLFEFVVVALFYLGFRNLAPQDRRFSTPAKLALLLLVAIAVVLAALIPLLAALNTLETCVSSAGTNSTAAAACISGGSLLAVLGVVLVAGIVALVGYIGLLIGVWRLGSRYQSPYFKAGAILLIFPILNIVGGVLILLAARSARDARRSAARF